MKKCRVTAHPSLALIKYWGKSGNDANQPAVPSLALTLEGLSSTTTVSESETDQILLNGQLTDDAKILNFLGELRKKLHFRTHFHVDSRNSFPTSAGLASSSSGFAALATAVLNFIHLQKDAPAPDAQEISSWARIGSGSASRAVFGGWTQWLAHSLYAEPLYSADYWPGIRVLLFIVDDASKPIGSREAMNLSKATSPFYQSWLDSSEALFMEAREALHGKDFQRLGDAARQSYLRMFSTMFTSQPPVIYWKERSLQLIRLADSLRKNGVGVFETMDAGPQVKFFCLEHDVATILERVRSEIPGLTWLVASPGKDPTVEFLD